MELPHKEFGVQALLFPPLKRIPPKDMENSLTCWPERYAVSHGVVKVEIGLPISMPS